jgi:hypothetical protein
MPKMNWAVPSADHAIQASFNPTRASTVASIAIAWAIATRRWPANRFAWQAFSSPATKAIVLTATLMAMGTTTRTRQAQVPACDATQTQCGTRRGG